MEELFLIVKKKKRDSKILSEYIDKELLKLGYLKTTRVFIQNGNINFFIAISGVVEKKMLYTPKEQITKEIIDKEVLSYFIMLCEEEEKRKDD